MKIINRKAFYEYFVIDEYIAGIILIGSEVKSIKKADVSIGESFIYLKDGSAWIKNMRVAQYKESTHKYHDELRDKKLLLHKSELRQIQKLSEKGTTIVPLEIFTEKNLIKLKIGVVKGKKLFDKRQSIKQKDLDREMKRGE